MKSDIPDRWNITSTEFAESALKVCQGIVLQLESLKPGTDHFNNHPPTGCPVCPAIHAVHRLSAFLVENYIKDQPEEPREQIDQ